MSRQLVWDLPVRIFHLLLGLSFFGAFAIANLVDDESPTYAVHMLLGLVMAHMVLLRVIWGFVGTRHARFRDFAFGPRAVLGYVRGVFRGDGERHPGHNPGSSVAIFAMFVFVVGLAVTGVLMGQGNKSAKDPHELFAWALFVTVIVHVLGVIVHTVKKRENITRSMIDGTKEVDPSEAIPGSRPIVGLVFLALVGVVGWHLGSSYDPATGQLSLPIFSKPLQLGEVEGAEGKDHEEREHRGERDHDDD